MRKKPPESKKTFGVTIGMGMADEIHDFLDSIGPYAHAFMRKHIGEALMLAGIESLRGKSSEFNRFIAKARGLK